MPSHLGSQLQQDCVAPQCAKTRPNEIRNKIGCLPRSRNLADRPSSQRSPELGNGWAGFIAADWKPASSTRSSLLVEINSLFLSTGNLSL